MQAQFPRADIFQAIRLEPYLEATAKRHPDLQEPLVALRRRTADAALTMIHGDVSPKNILLGPDGPVFLDAECACIGDPAFDLALMISFYRCRKFRFVATAPMPPGGSIKPNQAGTLSETQDALEASRKAGWEAIASARSGETEDITIVHLAVGWGVKQLKVGSFARSERMAKWNEGLRIAESLGPDGGIMAPRKNFPWG